MSNVKVMQYDKPTSKRVCIHIGLYAYSSVRPNFVFPVWCVYVDLAYHDH